MTIVSGFDDRGRKYYRSSRGGPVFYVTDYGNTGARELARRAERSVIGGYDLDLDTTGWTTKNKVK